MEQMKKDMILEIFNYVSPSELLDMIETNNTSYVMIVMRLIYDNHEHLVSNGNTNWELPAEIHQLLIDMK